MNTLKKLRAETGRMAQENRNTQAQDVSDALCWIVHHLGSLERRITALEQELSEQRSVL